MQQALTRLPTAPEREAHTRVDDETAAIVKALASRQRTSTTEDVATRVRSRANTRACARFAEIIRAV